MDPRTSEARVMIREREGGRNSRGLRSNEHRGDGFHCLCDSLLVFVFGGVVRCCSTAPSSHPAHGRGAQQRSLWFHNVLVWADSITQNLPWKFREVGVLHSLPQFLVLGPISTVRFNKVCTTCKIWPLGGKAKHVGVVTGESLGARVF